MSKPSRNELIAMKSAETVEAEVTPLNKPDNIPNHVWLMIMENGELATERLRQILMDPRFMRYKPSDQAKLIALAQSRAYGTPAPAVNPGAKNKKALDLTGTYFEELADRSDLPEYRNVNNEDDT